MKQCQHCGSKLSNPRAKNCDDCNSIKYTANKEGVYGQAVNALNEAYANGLRGKQVSNYARAVMKTAIAERSANLDAQRKAEREEERARRERKANREKTNSILRAHGYWWNREDEESMDRFGATAFETTYGPHVSVVWELVAPDGRTVTVEQALAEIAAKK